MSSPMITRSRSAQQSDLHAKSILKGSAIIRPQGPNDAVEDFRMDTKGRQVPTKQGLPFIYGRGVSREVAAEHEEMERVSMVDDDTGVDPTEVNEKHLQAHLQNLELDSSVPVRDCDPSPSYHRFYPEQKFDREGGVRTYDEYHGGWALLIQCADTVEQRCGPPYNMTCRDDTFLQTLNKTLAARSTRQVPCSEDEFEVVMSFFEDRMRVLHATSNVEQTDVPSLEQLASTSEEKLDERCREFAVDIYQHWRALRLDNGNSSIQPGLKTGGKYNSAVTEDPYICFMRPKVTAAVWNAIDARQTLFRKKTSVRKKIAARQSRTGVSYDINPSEDIVIRHIVVKDPHLLDHAHSRAEKYTSLLKKYGITSGSSNG